MAANRSGLALFLVIVTAVLGSVVLSRLGLLDKLRSGSNERDRPTRLSPGDFPAGVAAPAGDIAAVPLRATRFGFTPRGSSAALLLATGAPTTTQPPEPKGVGILETAYALEASPVVFAREEDLQKAFLKGTAEGGVDLAAMSVDRLAEWAGVMRDAAPRVVLLLGRSRGQEAIGAVGIKDVHELKGKRLAVYSQGSSYYFALWVLVRAELSMNDVRWVELPSNLDAGRAMREGRADAAAGLKGELELAMKDRGGRILATTADAPHLVVTVLVARGDYVARYPDAVRRIIRGFIDAANEMARDRSKGARLLGEVAPYLGDPLEAVTSAPPASLEENLEFFRLSGSSPVTYRELYDSASELFVRMGKTEHVVPVENTLHLDGLRSVWEARRP